MPITNRLDGVRRGLTSSRIKAGLGIILAVAVVLFAGCNGDEVDPTATRPLPPTPATPALATTRTPVTVFMPIERIYLPLVVIGPPLPVPTPTATPTSQPIRPTSTPTVTPTPTPEPCIDPGAPPPESAPPFVGLHASADPVITWQERCTFLELRPSLVKVQSFHPPSDIAKLAASQPQARWIVRSFLEFGGRAISPDEFVEFTLSDTQRSLDVLRGRDVVVELHNEPNLYAEGLGSAWQDGAGFQTWYLDVLAQYRAALPDTRFLFPAVSPGATVDGVRLDHVTFLEQNRAAIAASDGLGVHLYWSATAPMHDALATLDDIIARFPGTPIWITESSYNKGGIDDEQRAREYVAFIEALKQRPAVQGVTFFVASAQDPTFAPETWVGKRIAPLVGAR